MQIHTDKSQKYVCGMYEFTTEPGCRKNGRYVLSTRLLLKLSSYTSKRSSSNIVSRKSYRSKNSLSGSESPSSPCSLSSSPKARDTAPSLMHIKEAPHKVTF